jgi:ankyrin repeat protein
VLLEHGADVHIQGGDGNMTPLQLATSRGYPEIVQQLLEHGAKRSRMA